MTRASGSERRKRTHAVAVRLLPEEAASLSERAERAGETVGGYLRILALGERGPRGVRRPPVEKAELGRILGQLGKIGSNVNQVAAVANTTGVLAPLPVLNAMHSELRIMRDVVVHLQRHRT